MYTLLTFIIVPLSSVIVFGKIRGIDGDEAKHWMLYGLISKYYPTMTAGKERSPDLDQELKRTNMYAIESRSSKANWLDGAEQKSCYHSASFQISGCSAPDSTPISAKIVTACLRCAIASS
jgi:hypothetical protein